MGFINACCTGVQKVRGTRTARQCGGGGFGQSSGLTAYTFRARVRPRLQKHGIPDPPLPGHRDKKTVLSEIPP